jgi:hypothetical protein
VKIFLASLVAIAMIGMAVGVIMKRRCLRGTCGGLAHLQEQQGDVECAACGKRPVNATHADERQPVAEVKKS